MPKTFYEQVAEALRESLERGRWTGNMPGRDRLARELGVNGRTVERALAQLEQEGFLESQGVGRARKIVPGKKKKKEASRLYLKMILYERRGNLDGLILELQHRLESAGHRLDFASKTLIELQHDPGRVEKMVRAEPGGAWILFSAARPVLEWFSRSGIPCFACYGSMRDLPIAGAGLDQLPALREALHALIDRGHQRFVMLTRKERRRGELHAPEKLNIPEQVFLDELAGRGIQTGAYNLPDWEESAAGLRSCLDGLLRFSPPTAIFVLDPTMCLAVKNHLAAQMEAAHRRIVVVCHDYDPAFDWCDPPIAHFRSDEQSVMTRVTRWADNVARGKDDRRQNFTPAKFKG